MGDYLSALDELSEKPITRRRLLFWAVILTLVAFTLCAYESYTAAFQLSRLQKSADLLVQLRQLEAQGTNGSAEFQRARQVLAERTATVIETAPPKLDLLPTTLGFSLESLWKFAAGSALWLLGSILQPDRWRTRAGWREIGEQAVVGIAAGCGATLVPAVWWPWFHLFIYPCLFLGGLTVVMLPFLVLRQAVRRAQQKADTLSCLNNLKTLGLAAREWATDRGGPALPQDFSELKKYLPRPRALCCPAKGKRRYALLTPGASEADPSIVYARCPVHDLVLFTDGSVQQLGDGRLVEQHGVWRKLPGKPDDNLASR